MKILLQIIYIVIAAAVPSLCAAVLLLKPEARRSITRHPARIKKKNTDLPLEPIGGYWSVVLQNEQTNHSYKKIFRRRLLLGRRVDNQEYTGVLFLDTDSAISRQQCEIVVTGEGLVLNNLSLSNPTQHNGYSVNRPVFLKRGDDITIAGNHYIVQSISPEPTYTE
ncbi:MAG: FHA domain-containing protein [Erysipelotrichaceae bacterium]|nr:FHA domain-containing protein [Erysipelotrichaceae bacterium]